MVHHPKTRPRPQDFTRGDYSDILMLDNLGIT